ncbi:hypothetical protein DH2020_001298 [Rehmannia glutinosa]|uniref:Long-chain-alcohol oxidase n=1 Tax=Rehmannia glutinosa TaxID=99300 RepID=A0ABR0XZ14_REHGL
MKEEKEAHRLLKGGRKKGECSSYSHGFSSSQIQSLSAICQTLIPPLQFCDGKIEDNLTNQVYWSFHKSSGPDEVAELLVKRGIPKAVFIVSLVLKLLSSRLGTLLLCGFICLDLKWPFVHSFSELSLKKREAILQKWSRETFLLPLRISFLSLKVICLFVFFSLTDENSNNPAWEAIGYQVEVIERQTKPENERPLEKGIIEIMNEDESSLKESLIQKGVHITDDRNENAYKIKCDVVIIGSGCGGGVAAAVLAKSGQKVVVLEKGHYFVTEDYSGLEGPSMSELYESGGMLTTQDGKIMVMAGSTVGGGSSVNWSACIKTPDYILQEWSETNKIPVFAERFVLVSDSNEKFRKRCIGVIASTENKNIRKKLRIEAKVTISACGSLLTPPLLISSGLKNKNIGKNLHLHPVSFVWGYFPESLVEFKGKSFEGGIITSVHKVQNQESNIQAIVEAAALGPASFAALFPWVSRQQINESMKKYGRTAVLFALSRDQGSGEVKNQGCIKYRLSVLDRENLKTGLRRALRILISAGAIEVGTFRSDGQKIKCKGTKSEELEEFIDTVSAVGGPRSKSEYWTIYCSAHQMGSCRMGVNEDDGAVDENGECWEAKGLFVCDGSVLPSAVGVNPMVTIQSTAYCISTRLAESMKKGKVI